MGRPKGYDRKEILEKAMELYWERGFSATSTQDLVDHLGINRNTMYSAFGSKKAFFHSVLDHYEQRFVERNFASLESPERSIQDVVDLFDYYAALAGGPVSGKGCLLCNSATEVIPIDPSMVPRSQRFLDRVRAAFHGALVAGVDSGELSGTIDPAEVADMLTATWLGMLVMLRAKAPASVLVHSASQVRRHLGGLSTKPVA